MRLQRLLAKPDLTLQQAIEEAVAAETTEHSAQEIHKSSSLQYHKRLLPVHHNDVSNEKSSNSKDEEIYQVKPECGKFKKTNNRPI